jgi:hypothetical protein
LGVSALRKQCKYTFGKVLITEATIALNKILNLKSTIVWISNVLQRRVC